MFLYDFWLILVDFGLILSENGPVLRFGQPCVFPSKALGGDLGSLIAENGGEASGALGDFWPRMTQEGLRAP